MNRMTGCAAAALLLGAALLGPGAAGAAASPSIAGQEEGGAAPVGTWTGTMHLPDTDIDAAMAFHRDGRVCLVVPPPGPDGGVEGHGRWTSTGPRSFTFRVQERFFDGAGKLTGSLRAVHNASLRGNEFTTKGTAVAYDAAGKEVGTLASTGEMRRQSRQPAPCPAVTARAGHDAAG